LRTAASGKRWDKHPAVVLAALFFGLALLSGVVFREEVVTGNVYALGVSLAGLTRDQAGDAIYARAREVEEGPLTFAAGSRAVQVTQAEMKLLLDDGRLLKDLDSYVASRSRLLPSFFLRLGAKRVMAAPARVASQDAEKVFSRIAAGLSSEPLGSRYGFLGRELKVMPPQAGQAVTPQDVRNALDGVSGNRIEVSFRQIPAPAPTNLEPLSLLAEFSTPYDLKENDRNMNLALAAQAVHGKTLMPGETYSFNKEAGERTEAKGYKYASVVVGDHLEPGLAGGICQVTTTLFNAAAQAGLDLPEVHAHGIPVDYVPPGKDAAVAWEYLDIKIRNGTSSPVVFGSWVEGGKVTVQVLGKPSGRTYELLPVIVKEYPALGKKPGLLVETYRVERSGGAEVKRVLLLRSEYLPYVPVLSKD
jgi:vancomycin resistance protein YoaR